ncbi:MAG: S-adenosylmethionine:tRNA ribosyltransferase-isomerase [Bacteroidales bacterium]|nr:S-adenosylmethionine:tRNA ribosyltransferase-isomerase [Bacteroidales bacterium]
MKAPKNIAMSTYDYPLPNERIAKYPMSQRDQSKLLHYSQGKIEEYRFVDLPDLVSAGALMLFNDTKVIHARLLFQKLSGAIIEIFCLEPWQTVAPESFAQRERTSWLCLVGNNKKWKEGPLSMRVAVGSHYVTLNAVRREAIGEGWVIDFSWDGGDSFAEIVDAAGVIPLPPYLHRNAEKDDNERYQTVYADHAGSVAAPTAGLHFTKQVFQRLKEKNIDTEFITLQVGAGTFKPVTSETIGGHTMHVEHVQISQHNLQQVLRHVNDDIIAVGTTTVRTLESIYWFGVQLSINPELDRMHISQWDCYDLDSQALPLSDAYGNVLVWMERYGLDRFDGTTQLLIAPGYQYRVVKSLVTNFHQPKSTLLLLVSALIGNRWRDCYDYALSHDFRFLSYGDSCFFEGRML